MKKHSSLLLIAFILFSLASCKKTLNVNAEWKDVSVVFGLLDQTESVHYVKITKAFLGPGDALQFASISDSSNYDSLQVYMQEFNNTILLRTIALHDTLIQNKDSGIFYFPNQRVYVTSARLYPDLTYHLVINVINKDGSIRKTVEGSATLISNLDVSIPISVARASFQSGKMTEVKWTSAANGIRYQVSVRIHYAETPNGDPNQTVFKYLDWPALSNLHSITDKGGQTMDYYINGDGFYSFIGAQLKSDTVNGQVVTRALRICDFIFTVGSEDLSTYMDVTEPSMTIIQERPPFTDIINGIGLFSARTVKSVDSLLFSINTLDEIKTNKYTKNLGF